MHVQHNFFVHFFAVVLHDYNVKLQRLLRACLHGGGEPQIGEVTCGGSPHVSYKRDQIKMRNYVDRRVTHQSGLPHLTWVPHPHVNRPLVTRFMEEMSYVFSFPFFFFTAAHFHLALVAVSISHFVTAATKFSCCSSDKKMSPLFFISRSRSLSPFFSLSFASLLPTFPCSTFQICGHDS